jgi:hypothetical protein
MTDRDEAERRPVEDAAAKYRAWGYDVILDPTDRELPAFLQGYRPDFVARLGDQSVLVEVKQSSGPEELTRYRELAERVHSRQGWRLDLVVTNPSEARAQVSDYPLLPADEIGKRYDEAQRLIELGHDEAAVMLAWAATEAALRLLAEREAVEIQRSTPAALLKQLVVLGVISRDQYNQLWQTFQTRNAIAHGFAAREAARAAESVILAGRELLQEVQKAA